MDPDGDNVFYTGIQVHFFCNDNGKESTTGTSHSGPIASLRLSARECVRDVWFGRLGLAGAAQLAAPVFLRRPQPPSAACDPAGAARQRLAPWTGSIAPTGGADGGTEACGMELQVFLPPRDRASGTAVILCLGGGYIRHCTDTECWPLVGWLNQHGIASLILEYRLPAGHTSGGRHAAASRPALDALRAVQL
jgi:acetyl esterase/lipase